MAPVSKSYDIDFLSADQYWDLACLASWSRYTAFMANQIFDVLSETEAVDPATGGVVVTRVTRVTAIENPIPTSFRGMLGSDTFSYTRTDTFHRDAWDEQHKNTFGVEPPAFPDKITISGAQWLEATKNGCRACFTIDVSARVFGLRTTIEQGVTSATAKGLDDAYDPATSQMRAFAALRKVHPTAFDSASDLPEGIGNPETRRVYLGLAVAATNWPLRLRWLRLRAQATKDWRQHRWRFWRRWRRSSDRAAIMHVLARAVRETGRADAVADGGGGGGCCGCCGVRKAEEVEDVSKVDI